MPDRMGLCAFYGLKMVLYIKTAIVASIFMIGAASGYIAQGWRMGEQLAGVKASHAQTLQAIADKTAQARAAVARYELAAHAQLADKDAKYHKELTHAQSETARMRACIAAGTCGVRIITRTAACAAGGAMPQDAGAGRVGDGAIGLDDDTAVRVLDLRESVAADAAKLAYLREYASACYRAGVEGAGVVGGADSNPP